MNQKRLDVLNEISDLINDYKRINSAAGIVFSVNSLAGWLGFQKFIFALIDHFIDSIVQDESQDILDENSIKLRHIRLRIQYLRGQLELILSRLKIAEKNMIKAKRLWDDCATKIQ